MHFCTHMFMYYVSTKQRAAAAAVEHEPCMRQEHKPKWVQGNPIGVKKKKAQVVQLQPSMLSEVSRLVVHHLIID